MLNYVRRALGFSTQNTKVFGMSRSTELEKKIEFNRAKRRERVQEFLASANQHDKDQFLKDFLHIEGMLLHYATVSERLLVLIDNNIIQDIVKRNEDNKRSQRFHAFLAVLLLAEDYYLLDVYACISPAILFEALGKKINYPLSKIESGIEEVIEAIAELGLVTHLVGFNSAKELGSVFKKIRSDEKSIRQALDQIANSKWVKNFSITTDRIRIPFSVAEDECPDIKLKYFNPGVVKFILINLIEKKMYKENPDQPKARRLMQYKDEAFSIIKKGKNLGIEGLGDIDILASCDLTSQTMRNTPNITMGITYDDRLHATLLERSRIVRRSPTFIGGIDSSEDFTRSLVRSMQLSQKREAKTEQKIQNYLNALKEFQKDILN